MCQLGTGEWGLGTWEWGQRESLLTPVQTRLTLVSTPNSYKTPLELGIVPARRGSISTAIRIALANALNVASMM